MSEHKFHEMKILEKHDEEVEWAFLPKGQISSSNNLNWIIEEMKIIDIFSINLAQIKVQISFHSIQVSETFESEPTIRRLSAQESRMQSPWITMTYKTVGNFPFIKACNNLEDNAATRSE